MLWIRQIKRELSRRRTPFTETACALVTRYTLAGCPGALAPADATAVSESPDQDKKDS